jgi:SAM-dependent methyltransferase
MIKFLLSLVGKQPISSESILESEGYCSTCNKTSFFVAKNAWLRDHFLCSKCGSIPRERALMQVVEQFFPNWKDLIIHETSPGNRGASVRFSQECKAYIPSQFFQDQKLGSLHNGIRCENLEELAFGDESIDLHISQDVMEHIFHPAKAFQEIARTLKPGGAHIFTVPLVNKMKASKLRAKMADDGSIEHIEKPIYHGNPIDSQGSLVTMDWGYDIVKYIFDATGLFTYTLYVDDISKGIRAEYIEVLVTVKPAHDIGC